MSALSPGPAPGLVTDWITIPSLAWAAILGLAAFAVIIWWTTELLKTWHAKSAELDQVLEQGPPQPHRCNITGCHQPATYAWPTGVTGCTYYTCTGHAAVVRAWAGPYDHDVPYDQDLDSSDLALWEREVGS